MPTAPPLYVRDLPPKLTQALHRRAARDGTSVSALVRQLLTAALMDGTPQPVTLDDLRNELAAAVIALNHHLHAVLGNAQPLAGETVAEVGGAVLAEFAEAQCGPHRAAAGPSCIARATRGEHAGQSCTLTRGHDGHHVYPGAS